MKVLILAAGIGSRLGHLTKDKPKPLLKLNREGMTILGYQLAILENTGKFRYSDVFIVGGHKFETLMYLKDKGVNLIFNPRYQEYNNIYSFYLAKDYLFDNFILINGDTLFHPSIIRKIVKATEGTYFVIDNVKKLGEEEMKVLVGNNRILRFGKDLDPKNASGEYIGVAKFDIHDAKLIFDKMDELIKSGKTNIWYELAINHVLDKIIARPVYTNGLPWIEVDTPEDYKVAREMFKRGIINDL